MRIALLAHNLHTGGGYTLGRELIHQFLLMAGNHDYVISLPESRDYSFLESNPKAEMIRFPVTTYWERYRREMTLARRLDQWGCDWAWWLGNLGFVFPRCPQSVYVRTAYTVDYPLKNWGISPWDLKFRLRRYLERLLIRRTMSHSRSVYVQTDTMRTRILRTYPFLRESDVHLCRVRTLFSEEIEPSLETKEFFQRLSVTDYGRFRCLYVSHYHPHKNIDRILTAFSRYRDALSDVVLYLTIDAAKRDGQILTRKLETLQLTNSVRLIGQYAHTDIPYLYRNADISLFPTLLETIGHGHIESMYFGLPLIASDIDFAHECCADAAYYIDPFSCEAIAKAIVELRDNPRRRSELSRLGILRTHVEQPGWHEILGPVLDAEGITHD